MDIADWRSLHGLVCIMYSLRFYDDCSLSQRYHASFVWIKQHYRAKVSQDVWYIALDSVVFEDLTEDGRYSSRTPRKLI